jgi:hypothetical protein
LTSEFQTAVVSSGTKPRPRKRWRLLWRIAAAVVYLPLFGEVFIRLIHPVPLFPRRVVAMPFGVRGNQPNARYTHTSADVQVEFRLNSKGVRADREIPYEKPPGVARIVVLGDSFGMGYEVSVEDMFVSYMQRSLERSGIPVEVVNLSVSGHGNAEELVTLQNEGFKYQPDLVLVSWHFTDLDDNVRSDLFRVVGDKLEPTGKSYLPAVGVREKLERLGPYRWLEEHSMLFAFVRESLSARAKNILMSLKKGESAEVEVSDESGGEGAPAKRNNARARAEDALTVAILQSMQETCRTRGAEMMILDIPRREGQTVFYSMFPTDPAGKNFGLRVVSPIDEFKRNKGVKLYHERSHGHFTPAATKIVGELLARQIMSAGLLERYRKTAESQQVAR